MPAAHEGVPFRRLAYILLQPRRTMRTRAFILGTIVAVLLAIGPAPGPPRRERAAPELVSAPWPAWQVGFAFWGPTADYASPAARASLASLQQLGVGYVNPIVSWYVSSKWGTDVAPGVGTPSDEALSTLAAEAKALGLKVVLSVRVESRDGTWRGFLEPADPPRWFAGYRQMVEHYADLAQQQGVAGLVIGSEMVSLTKSQHTQQWEEIIAAARARFSGFLTYGATWGMDGPNLVGDHLREFVQIEFWPLLDYLGLVGYFELSQSPDPSPDELQQAWGTWYRSQIAPFQARYGKPLLFTEAGYKSVRGAAAHPWDDGIGGAVDLGGQARLYQAFFEFWQSVPWVAGAYFWHWIPDPAAGGPLDNGYTPQNKPAADTVASWITLLRQMEKPGAPAAADASAR